jgi:predicted SAM-dependent methyltransferase
MSLARRSLGAVRRRILGLSGLDPHLASLEAHSNAIEARLAAITDAVDAQTGSLAELSETLQTLTRAHRDRQLVAHYLATSEFPVLHLGCGELKRPGWLNTDAEPASDDVVALDMRGPYPFESDSFSAVYTEHSIEHLDLAGGREMLRHCYRVLKPHGVLRVATPDQHQIISLLSDDSPAAKNYLHWAYRQFHLGPPNTPALVVNNFFREWGHQLIYDELTLSELLREIGFCDVQRMEIGHSQYPELDGAEMHGLSIGEEQNRIETMVLEATKPAL